MKPLYTKKNGTSQRVAAIEVKMPASYPAAKVTYGSGSVKDALDALQKTVVTGTLASVAASFVTVSYPSGFSRDNCFVLSFEIFIQGTWRAGEGFYASGFARDFYVLGSDDIKVYNDNNLLLDCPFRLILAKL